MFFFPALIDTMKCQEGVGLLQCFVSAIDFIVMALWHTIFGY